MVSRFFYIVIGMAALMSAQTARRASDGLIIPGVRVGPVSRNSTELSLIRSLGRNAVRQNVDSGEGIYVPGLVLYKDDPTRRLEIIWNQDVPAHPQYILICPGNLAPRSCRWRTAEGIGIGTTLKELERLNGKPFRMVIWGTDAGGNVVSFDGGALASFDGKPGFEAWNSARLGLRLEPRHDSKGNPVQHLSDEESDQVDGSDSIIVSSHPVVQKINPYVAELTQVFPRDGAK